MKHINKILVMVFAVILILSTASCSVNIYKKGVSDYREYPEDDLPIYDDAVVFKYDYNKDRKRVKLSYGTGDDIDDVIEFYQDYFEDEEVYLVSEDEKRDEYSAEGRFDDFSFEINIEEAGREESKYFETVVDIKIDYSEEEPEEQEEAAPPTDEAPVEAAALEGLPIVMTAYGNTYIIDDVSVGADENGNTTIIVTGSGFDIMPMRDGQFRIPVLCSIVAGSDEYEIVSVNVASTNATFVFDVSVSPDSVVFYPGDDIENRFVVELG